jgi:hypothetical protein
MKIIAARNHAHIIDGVVKTISTFNSEIVWWDVKNKPALDIMDEIEPGLVICCPHDISPGLTQGVKEYNSKLVVFGAGKFTTVPDLICLPSEVPDATYSQANDIAPTIKIEKAARLVEIWPMDYDENYASDILYISDIPINVQPAMLPYLKIVGMTDYKFKIVGNQHIPFAQYMGVVNNIEISKFLSSTKLVIDFDGNVIYDSMIFQKPCITNLTEYPFCESFSNVNGEDFIEFLRKERPHVSYKHTLENHTYHHRVRDIFQKLKLPDMIDKCMANHKEVKKRIEDSYENRISTKTT